jgi:hypothetical protein
MEIRRVNTFNNAITAALAWLKTYGVTTLDEAFRARSGSFGMRTATGSSGYRLEFDSPTGAHIHVWLHKLKGSYYVFMGNEPDVWAKWRQLFWWDSKLKMRIEE